MLPDYVRVLQGDGVTLESIATILSRMEKEGWSAENVSFGSGGGLLQKLDRDTQKCAYKCSFAVIDGKEVGGYFAFPGLLSSHSYLLFEYRLTCSRAP